MEHYLSSGEPVAVEGVGRATTFHRLACAYVLRTRASIYSGLMTARHEEDYRPIAEVLKLRIAGKTVPRDLAKQNQAAVKCLEERNRQAFRLPETVEDLKDLWTAETIGTIQTSFWPGDPGAISQAFLVGIENEHLGQKKAWRTRRRRRLKRRRRRSQGSGGTAQREKGKRGRKPGGATTDADTRLFKDWKASHHATGITKADFILAHATCPRRRRLS